MPTQAEKKAKYTVQNADFLKLFNRYTILRLLLRHKLMKIKQPKMVTRQVRREQATIYLIKIEVINKNYGNVINRPQNNTKHVGFDSILTIREKKKHFYDDVFPSSTKKFIPHFRNECSFFMTARVLFDLFVTIDSILSKGYLLIKCIPLFTLSSPSQIVILFLRSGSVSNLVYTYHQDQKLSCNFSVSDYHCQPL